MRSLDVIKIDDNVPALTLSGSNNKDEKDMKPTIVAILALTGLGASSEAVPFRPYGTAVFGVRRGG
jgi:hypothetical protein